MEIIAQNKDEQKLIKLHNRMINSNKLQQIVFSCNSCGCVITGKESTYSNVANNICPNCNQSTLELIQ